MDDEGTTAGQEQSGPKGVGNEIFDQVEALMRDEGVNRTQAFQRLSDETGRRAGTVAANYYRVAKARGATLQPRRPRGGGAAAPRQAPSAGSPRGGGADAALGRAMQALQDLTAIVKQQDQELTRLRSQAQQVERIRAMVTSM